MAKQTQIQGGFACRNTGTLENCYAAVHIGSGKTVNAGFVYDNSGTIKRCFTRSRTRAFEKEKKEKRCDGFVSNNTGTVEHSFFLVKEEKDLENFRDRELGVCVEQADETFLRETFRWDFQVFEQDKASQMDFEQEHWHYERQTPTGQPQLIQSEKEFLEVVEKINRGEQGASSGWYELQKDLNFHGRQIPPIGFDNTHPFCGVFDGKGHCIRGFVIKGQGLPGAGLFGYLAGMVMNLRIDGVIKAKGCPSAAAFCAVNQGEIHCCEAVCEVHASRYLGMFVQENHGLIERCCVSGKSHGIFVFWLLPLLPLLALGVVLLCNPVRPPVDYPLVPVDGSIVPNREIEIIERSNENKASYQVPKTLKVDAETLTAKSEPYVIKNPNRGANYDFVATLYMTNNLNQRVEVYQSGRIPIGYHIENLTLTPPAGTVLSPGSYDAQIVFSFYHHDSREKGMVDSTVPITVEIQ